jgi:hypothetical protein
MTTTTATTTTYTIFCLLEGQGRDAFPVDIDKTRTVGHLKNAIKSEKPVDLAAVDPDHLKLYYVNLEFDKPDEGGHITRAKQIFKDLSTNKPLKVYLKLSEIDGGLIDGGFLEKRLHVLVQLPPGESIRACDVRR